MLPGMSSLSLIRSPRRALRKLAASANERTRSWLAAKSSRLFAGWQIAADDLNAELERQLAPLRGRSRELEQNNDLARRYLKMCETHIIGPNGMRLEVRGVNARGQLDARGNRRVEQAWQAWGRRGSAEITGRLSWSGVERLAVRTLARDGEVLLRFWDVDRNPEGFAVEVIDPARLDHTQNGTTRAGNAVRLGIELDGHQRPLAYYIRPPVGDNTRPEPVRVPAGDIVHVYLPERPGQLRGVPWMASAMVTMHQLEKYQEAALTAAREGAAKMGIWYSPDGAPDAIAPPSAESGYDQAPAGPEFMTESEAGVFAIAPEGYRFETYDPAYPHELYAQFMQTNHRTIAQGLGVSYHALTGDLTQVNFSSIRAGELEQREGWKVLQDDVAEALHAVVMRRWVRAAIQSGAHGLSFPDPVAAIERYSAHRWHGRRWTWVDPKNDAATSISLVAARLKSPQQVAAEMGLDIEEVIADLAAFEKRLADTGLSVSPETPPAAQTTGADDDDDTQDD